MKIGDYVRTKYGNIGKIREQIENCMYKVGE